VVAPLSGGYGAGVPALGAVWSAPALRADLYVMVGPARGVRRAASFPPRRKIRRRKRDVSIL